MCEYCDYIEQRPHLEMNNGDYWITKNPGENRITYTKPPNANRVGYTKAIPLESLHEAQEQAQPITRQWFNTLPESKSRPCNYKVMIDILNLPI